MVFTNDVIVDTPLATEFFKHLPAIFTGVGIIGTFWGVIQGLQAFRISDDPIVVRTSLEELMHYVSAAFIVSAMAIFLAMIATLVEKSLVTVLYGKVEEITARLDSFLHSGASEEYLARLAKASEGTSTQSQLLKDALVTDLERILTTLTERQIEAQSLGFGLGRQLADGVAVSLQKPLEDLAEGIRRNTRELGGSHTASDRRAGRFQSKVAGVVRRADFRHQRASAEDDQCAGIRSRQAEQHGLDHRNHWSEGVGRHERPLADRPRR